MADERVIVPIELTVTDIKTGDVSLKDVQKSMESKLAGIAKSAGDVLGKIDPSKLNKALNTSMDKVTSSYNKLAIVQSKFDEALVSAGSSSTEYKKKLQELNDEAEKVNQTYTHMLSVLDDDPKAASGFAKLAKGLSMSDLTEGERWAVNEQARLSQEMDDAYDRIEARKAKLNPRNFIHTATSSELQKLINAYYTMFGAIDKVNSATENWNKTVANNQMTDEYTKKAKELEAYEKKLESVRAKAQKMSTVGASNKSWKNLVYDASLLEQKINQIIVAMQEMVNTGSAFRFSDGDSAAQLDMLEERLINVSNTMREIEHSPGKSTSKIEALDKTVTKFCASASKGLANVISMFKRMERTSSHTSKNISKSMKKLWKDILMFGFGVRSTFFLVRRLRNVFINSFKEMATQIPEVNTQISSFMTSLNQIKGSLATAFQPIVSAIIPWLNQLCAALNSAMNAMARFFATLTGQGYIYKFTAAQVDYADSLDKTGSAAKKAQKSLMGFDEINRLNDNSDSGGGGGDTPTGTWEKEMLDGMSTLAEMIKEAWSDGDFYDVGQYIGEKLLGALKTADEWITTKGYALAEKIGKSLATLLNGVIETQDLGTQIGKTIADGLNMGMIGIHKFFTTANWVSLGQFLADWANASVKNFKWDLLGQTVASVITAGVNTWWKFAGEFDFSALGNSISTAINNLFSNLLSNDSASRLGQAITNTVRGILTTLTTAINNTDWTAVGRTIGEVLANIDWSGIAIDVWALVKAVVKAIADAFREWKDVDPISANIAAMIVLALATIKMAPIITGILSFGSKFIGGFKKLELGKKIGDIFADIAPYVDDALIWVISVAKGIFVTLKDILIDASGQIVNAVKKIIGAYNAHKTAVGGGLLIAGVVTAISNFIDMLNEGFNWFSEICMLIGLAIAAVGAVIAGLVTGPVAALIAGIVAAAATIVVLVKDNWAEISAFLSKIPGWFKDSIVTPVANFFKNLGTDIATFFKNALTSIQNTWKTIVSWFTNTVINPVKNGFSNALNSIKGFFSNCLNGVKSTWNGAIAWFKNVANNIKTAFNNAVSGVKSAFSGLWSSVKAGCRTAFNAVIGFIERGINGLINGINKAIGAINSIGKGAAKLAGINFTGISKIPTVSLPRLAQGGVIPPNNEFMAILGDQKHGTNIEAPLDTIKQAVAEELAEYIDAMMTGFQAVVDAVNDKDFDVRIGDNAIGKAAERYSKRQALIRGTT